MDIYAVNDLTELLRSNPYPGRGIVLGQTPDGKHAVTAYFIMGRSANSRNRIFVEEPDGIRTEAYDPHHLPSRPAVRPGPDRHQRRPDRHHPGLPEKRPAHGAGPAHPGI